LHWARQSFLRRQKPDAPEPELQRERDKAFRAPTIVVVAAKLQKGHRIPEVEQIDTRRVAFELPTMQLAVRCFRSVTSLADGSQEQAYG